jgi:hypothetical protein
LGVEMENTMSLAAETKEKLIKKAKHLKAIA